MPLRQLSRIVALAGAATLTAGLLAGVASPASAAETGPA